MAADPRGDWLYSQENEVVNAETASGGRTDDEIATAHADTEGAARSNIQEVGTREARERRPEEDDGRRSAQVRQVGVREAAQQDGSGDMGGLSYRREVELCRREKELAEKELALVQRELELLRMSRRDETLPAGQTTRTSGHEGSGSLPRDNMAGITAMTSRANVSAIADLLGDFSGNSEELETWLGQVRFLRTAYNLDDGTTKILIGTRLKGRALEWFRSRKEYITLSSDGLLFELQRMFYHRPDKIALRRRFEERMWKKGETFQDYVHDKVIMANRIGVDDDEVLRYIVNGIPDTNLRDIARVQGFASQEQLVHAFQEIRLEDRGSSGAAKGSDNAVKRKDNKSAGANKSDKCEVKVGDRPVRRCFNCGERDHVSASCPVKDKGAKCFGCNEHGHVASKCPAKQKNATNTCAVTCAQRRKNFKDVLINDVPVRAIIDTGSDITIMRAAEYIKVGSPPINRKPIAFRGVGKEQNATLGEFRANLGVDENSYTVTIHVVSDELCRCDLLIGKDFLDTIELDIKLGVATIKPIDSNDDAMAEICRISIEHESETSAVDLSHLQDVNLRERVDKLVEEYKPAQTRDVDIKMKILLKDEESVNLRPRRLAPTEREMVNRQIDEWLEAGVIQPSISDYASPVVLTKKKNGSMRLCVDYRAINKKIIKDRYPIPLVEDQLDALQNATIFSTLDLKDGFFHVSIEESSRKYTAFVVPDGHYEFTKVPFGLCNSPAIFQKFINAVFKDLIRKQIVLVYMDDLIIPSVDYSSGLERLEHVLIAAGQYGLNINWRKCSLLQARVEYLGYEIEGGCIRPSKRKTDAVRKFPIPTNVRQVQQFLGLTGYFRKFMPGYSIVARPLTNLLKTGVEFKIGEPELAAVNRLKTMLTSRPVLHLYGVGLETELHTDASSFGYGAILLQRSSEDHALHPVYYSSGKTTSAEQKYTSYELEVLAIIKALKKFRVYLLSMPFKIVTDCRAFTMTMAKRDLCVRIARWALYLEDYNYTLEHRPGKSMAHVDALSRNPLPMCLLLEEDDNGLTARLKKAQANDQDVKRIIQLTKDGKTQGYSLNGGLLFKEVEGEPKLVVPRAMQSSVVKRAHERGHFGVAKTEAIIKRDYYIQNLRSRIEKTTQNCVDCILANKQQGKQEGFLHCIDKGELPLDTYHVDHLGPLASTKKNYRHIFAIIDGFSKFVWLYATKSTGSAEVLSRLRRQAAIFGNPRRIVSDRGTAFTSGDFEQYCKQEDIQHVLTTTGIPRANGQIERTNRILIPLLTKLAAPEPGEWHKHLEIAQQYLNTTVQRSISMTPFQLLFGTHARLREDPQIRELLEQEWTKSFQEEREELRAKARESIAKVQRENRRGFNAKRKEAKRYREGDWVAIRRTQQAPGTKLAAKYFGPYEIIRSLRNDRYVVLKVGNHEGPQQTSSSADYMKIWSHDESDSEEEEEEHSEVPRASGVKGEQVAYIRGECNCRTAECRGGSSASGA